MAWSGGKEQPLADRQVGIFQREAEAGSFPAGGFVGFVENGQVKGLYHSIRANRHTIGHHRRRLISGEDNLDAVKRLAEEPADGCTFRCYRKIEIGLMSTAIEI